MVSFTHPKVQKGKKNLFACPPSFKKGFSVQDGTAIGRDDHVKELNYPCH